MYLVTVTPITKEPLKENLSYFTRSSVKVGDIVLAPIRSKTVRALVVSSEGVLENKSALKSSPFPIKKITAAAQGTVFSPSFVKGIEKAAALYATFPGNLLRAYIPDEILEKWDGLQEPPLEPRGVHEVLILQAPSEERLAIYRAMIREEFAKKKSILMLAPSRIILEGLQGALSKGIDEYTVLLHGELGKKEQLTEWKRATETQHPVLILATPGFLALPRTDLGVIVVEHESSSGYKNMFRPLVDSREVARLVAECAKTKIIFADTLLSVETMSGKELKHFIPLSPIKHRLVSSGESSLIDMKKRADPKADPFFSEELLRTISETVARKGHVFLFAVRRGLAPLTVCSDCGTTLGCPNCARPLVLFQRNDTKSQSGIVNIYVCNSCETEFSSEMRCVHCNSWRLMPLGIGTEKVHERLHDYFPETPLFRIDSDAVRTHKQGLAITQEFHETRGSILIGTEMALQYLPEVEASAVVSIDNLLAIPDYHINEKIMHILIGMREKTTGPLLIQTRKPEMKVFHHAARGTLLDFYRDEMQSRKQFRYPPYAVFIKISREGKSAEVEHDMQELEKQLEAYGPEIFSGFYTSGRGEELLHALIRIAPEKWPDTELLALLRTLPHKFVIDVDPEELL